MSNCSTESSNECDQEVCYKCGVKLRYKKGEVFIIPENAEVLCDKYALFINSVRAISSFFFNYAVVVKLEQTLSARDVEGYKRTQCYMKNITLQCVISKSGFYYICLNRSPLQTMPIPSRGRLYSQQNQVPGMDVVALHTKRSWSWPLIYMLNCVFAPRYGWVGAMWTF